MLLIERSHLSLIRGEFEAAVRMLEQLSAEQRLLGDVRAEQVTMQTIAEAEHALGRTQRSNDIQLGLLPALRAGKNKVDLANTLANRAGYLVALGDAPGAVAAASEAIGIFARHEPDHTFNAIAIEHLALVYALRGEVERAANLEGFVGAAYRRHGLEREFTETKTYNRLMSLLRDGHAPDELERLFADGATLTPEAAIALALAE
jgi:hypothetical protein